MQATLGAIEAGCSNANTSIILSPLDHGTLIGNIADYEARLSPSLNRFVDRMSRDFCLRGAVLLRSVMSIKSFSPSKTQVPSFVRRRRLSYFINNKITVSIGLVDVVIADLNRGGKYAL